jgi:hypothetical protein
MQQCGSKKSDTSKVKVNLLVVVVVFAAAEKNEVSLYYCT